MSQRKFNSLKDYLQAMLEAHASDLFLRTDGPPAMRIQGTIVRTDYPIPSAAQMQEFIDAVATPLARERFQATGDLDMACSMPGLTRFRINLFRHGGQIGLVARAIPSGRLDLQELHLPLSLLEMAEAPMGLILVVGPTGCGKSTTMAALVNHINHTRSGHIVTIEDPIEFVHVESKCLIHHRQVGVDTKSFSIALRHVVRQNPDVILIGEMRDRDTVKTAMTAALTGHLILTTLHTTGVVQSIDRILNYYESESRNQARHDLANTLVGIVSMRLLPMKEQNGRVPAMEILRGTPTVRRVIAENRLSELYDIMKQNQDRGMCTFNQSLLRLSRDQRIDAETAIRISPNPDELRLNMQGMFTGIDSIDARSRRPDDGDAGDGLGEESVV
ncbi:PilT/PilU family type 4a pilus ATPase [bacterium]|nr:PilT/PilU family type 4a pilus ATPase [candidate division CSSED10-310 bacterium]